VVGGLLPRKTSIGASSKVILIWLKSVPLLWSILFTTQFAANTTELFFWGKTGKAGPKIASGKLLAEGTEHDQARGGVNENVEPRRTTTGDDIC
jgi:hypothetical protein